MFLELVRKRRSIREFKDRPLSPETLAFLEEVVLRSPSSRGLQPWRFVFVQDKGTLAKLSRAKKHGSEFLADAALGVVILADPAQCDVWIEDCSIAAILVQMAAESVEGLGSCWIQIRLREDAAGRLSEEVVREILGVPADLRVASIIAVGYADETLPPVPEDELPRQRVFRERYGA